MTSKDKTYCILFSQCKGIHPHPGHPFDHWLFFSMHTDTLRNKAESLTASVSALAGLQGGCLCPEHEQQIGELRRQNQILARKIRELEAKQVGSSEPVQEAEAEDGDDGSSVTSRLTSVSRQDADTVVGPASITGSIGRIESLEHKTEQLEASVATLPTQIMSAVRESFQDMFTAALTQALPEIVAQVSNSVLKAMQPWVIAQIKNTTQSDSPQVKRKPASRQAAEEGFSGPAPGPDRSSAP
ncbi:hypothetical protein MRX96_011766 [Rhipicephalus microplus]